MIIAPLSSKRVQQFGNKKVVAIGLLIVTLGLFGYRLFAVNSPIWLIIGLTMLIGLGMGNVLAPATDSIMGSLPRAKAGVGSAMNDTTRQTGGAVGVAVLGSVLASRFTSGLSHAASLAHLPPAVAAQARMGITDALAAAQTPAAARYHDALVSVAKQSFLSGFHWAAVIGGSIIFCAALGTIRWLPARERAEEPVYADEPELRPGLAPAFND